MFVKNRARLSIQLTSQMTYLLENHLFAVFSEAELQDLSLEDDG